MLLYFVYWWGVFVYLIVVCIVGPYAYFYTHTHQAYLFIYLRYLLYNWFLETYLLSQVTHTHIALMSTWAICKAPSGVMITCEKHITRAHHMQKHIWSREACVCLYVCARAGRQAGRRVLTFFLPSCKVNTVLLKAAALLSLFCCVKGSCVVLSAALVQSNIIQHL